MTRAAHQMPLVVVGGWGVDAAMLLPLFDNWRGKIHTVSLADPVVGRCESIAAVAAYLLARYPFRSVWAGWSQGAQVVMEAASQGDLQVASVITIAGFPRFLAAPDWPAGMAADTFGRFRTDMAGQAGPAWRRFQQLLIRGCGDHSLARKELLPWLKRGAITSPASLVRGLDWLEAENQLDLWCRVRVPTLHLQAEQDAVVRPWVDTFTPSESATVVSIPGMTHWPRGDVITPCREAIHGFLSAEEGAWLA